MKLSSIFTIKENEQNPTDKISMDVQLFIRVLEWAREESGADVPIHIVAEDAAKLSSERGTLHMDDYEEIMQRVLSGDND